MTTEPTPLNVIDLMKVVMDADNETRGFALRGTTNWAAHIGKAVQNAILARWGQPSGAGEMVAYLDIGAGGYLDLGSELSEDALQQLPKGRHALVIAGTYGVDGYVAAPQPSPTTKPAPQQDAQEPVAWESTTPGYIKYITQARYEKFSPAVRRWYKPYRCSGCAARAPAMPSAPSSPAAKQSGGMNG